ncbi:methylated-DNA--[protein]-cysteine S-methyltransferase [Anaerococcus sp. AGMB00486]|uniref:Methylated-DNA--[protein]-cysteine S-methyltransferase n=2 Tax=Anaerococcus TaxID=165779 RepID=A0ABX2NBU6_9FIRM|nr:MULTISPECIES: methylated-DNA--[protein]-cysteine S-methyltransferase [Anaerococcus]MSS78666.1 methylated-DNA--[protein]-cysteine S-methyltransferase [Anaerococcus porci]NVF12167.1 methylated-DNA--[protein]-cysteine S-methyltransferase [Anaerococcus faecalis]
MRAYYKKDDLIFEIGYEDIVNEIKLVEKVEKDNKPSLVSDYAFREITLYLDGKLKKFSFPIKLKGTDFQKRVWEKLLEIPYGKTITYKEIGQSLDSKAYRAIGSACGKNPLVIRVPCHRVLSQKGLGGYLYGLDLKRKLLKLENKNFYI